MDFLRTGIIFFLFCFTSQQFAFSQTATWNWAKNNGGKNDDIVESSSRDNNTLSVSGAFYSDTILLDKFSFVNTDSTQKTSDAFVAEYDEAGNIIWATTIGGPGEEHATAAKTGLFIETYLAGTFTSENIMVDTFQLHNLDGHTSSFFIKYFKEQAVWVKTFQDASIKAMAIDPETGKIAITGTFTVPSLKLGPNTLLNKGGSDIFIALYDSNGNLIGARSLGAEGDENVNFINATPSYKTFCICGSSTSQSWNNKGGKDIFIATYNSELQFQWKRDIGGTEEDEAVCIKQNFDENIYVTGNFSSPSISFDNITLTNNGNGGNSFLAQYDADGHIQWANAIGGINGNGMVKVKGMGVSYTHSRKQVYIAGQFTTPNISFDNYLLSNNGSSNLFMVFYSTQGNVEEALTATASQTNSNVVGIHQDNSNNILTVGNFRSDDIQFGPNQLTNTGPTGTSDFFITLTHTVTDISGWTNNKFVSVYPNPTTGKINLKSNKSRIEKIRVFSSLGQIILSAQDRLEIDLSGEKPGVYFIEIQTKEHEFLYEKIILR